MTIPETKSMDIKGSSSSELLVGVLCVNVDPDARQRLETIVSQMPGAYVVDNVDLNVTPREVLKLLDRFHRRVCIIDFDEPEEGRRVSERLSSGCEREVSIFAAAGRSHPDVIITAMRSGCSEYLLKPFESTQVLEGLSRVQSKRPGSVGEQKGKVITLMGAKGGTGVTSLALHLALNLVSQHSRKCLLIDLHPALGDLVLYLGLNRHQYSFYELVHNMDRLDADLLEGFLIRHSSGLDVLDSPEAIHAFPATPSDAIEHTLAFLGGIYQFVIIDCPPGLSDDTSAAIRQSDQLEIIITPELPSLHNALRTIDYLTNLHYPSENIDIVLNRYSRRSPLGPNEIENSVHRNIAVTIPNDYTQLVNAINAGTPVHPSRKSDLTLAFDTWAERLVGEEGVSEPVPKEKTNRRGVFSIFGS